MSRATQPSGDNRQDVSSQPGPITKVPPEIVMEVFKFAVLSSEEARSHGVKTLCLVGQDWNRIANGISDLWTKVTLSYPLHPGQLSVVKKWLKASEQKTLDLEIDLRDPAWDEFEDEALHPLGDSTKLQGMIAVLRDSEHRWRSISFKSDVWEPIHEFLRWEIPSLPLLESISFERGSEDLGAVYNHLDPQESSESPTVFGGNGTHMPALRKVSLSVVNVNWASAAASFQNLRELGIRNQSYEVGPTFKQFAALLAASPRLETLDVTGYCPNSPAGTEGVPLVYLPALRHFVFGWTDAEPALTFLEMFQIPESLETLSLIDTVSGIGISVEGDSSPIFDLLARLGQGGPRHEDHPRNKEHLKNEDHPRDRDHSRPWVSVLGLKSLSVSWVKSRHESVMAFLMGAPMVEEIHLTDVSQGVLLGIEVLAETQRLRSLKRLYIRWVRDSGDKSPEADLVTNLLRGHGFQVIVENFIGEDECSTPMRSEAIFNDKDGERRP